MIQPFHLVSHFTGVGDSINSVLLGSTGYTDFDNVYSPGSYARPLRSYVTWKDAKNPASPTDRWLRFKYPTFFSFLLTVKPTAANWQSRLTRIEVGSQRWLRPSHVHCVQSFTPVSGSEVSSGEGDRDLTVVDPSGNPIPNALVVVRRRENTFNFVAAPGFPYLIGPNDYGYYVGVPVSDDLIYVRANASGVASNVLSEDPVTQTVTGSDVFGSVWWVMRSVAYTITVYDETTAWRGIVDNWGHNVFSQNIIMTRTTPSTAYTFSGTPTQEITTYLPTSAPTGKIDQEVWPHDTFTAWGTAYVAGGKDWMPPIVIEAINESGYGFSEGTQPFPCECNLTMLRINNFRYTGSGGFMGEFANLDAPPRTNTPAGSSPFAFSRHASLPAGLYTKKSTYPATYASPSARWESVTGSDATGYTPPTSEPSCDFVVKEGES